MFLCIGYNEHVYQSMPLTGAHRRIATYPKPPLGARELHTILTVVHYPLFIPNTCVHAVQMPVHLFVTALVRVGGVGGKHHIMATELTVPLVCASKRMKKHKNKLATDYIYKATTEKLHYAWHDAIASLYDDKTPRW